MVGVSSKKLFLSRHMCVVAPLSTHHTSSLLVNFAQRVLTEDDVNVTISSAAAWVCSDAIETCFSFAIFVQQSAALYLNKANTNMEDVEKLHKQLKQEQLLKMQAVNKLAEIMNRKDMSNTGRGKNKVSSAELRKREKECRKLQQELTQEREKYGQMAAKWQKDLQELQSQAQEDNMIRLRLQMELDSKDSEIEQLQIKMASLSSETASLSSGGAENDDDILGQESRLEGWLSIPNKQNIRRHGWKKQYVVVSSKKIIFYNSESDKQNLDPVLILDLNKVFHVRSVTQGDVIRADAKDIPRIFQLLYAGEGEVRRPDEGGLPQLELTASRDDKPGTYMLKGHEFVQISYHMPTNCEVCPKPLWHMFKPPPALECRRCRIKVHREHLERKEEAIAPCKLHYDPNSAKELLLLATNMDDQKQWIQRLGKKIQKCGYKANSCVDGAKVSPRRRYTNHYISMGQHSQGKTWQFGVRWLVQTPHWITPPLSRLLEL
uniref:non-specific serine/threonine protein kinase n=1 Tax=Timema shepardi TaxID=629360 RepID=A0A7R9G1J9_TIMSH|nr:unnamed protein product [Timema shepardi]